MSKSNAKKPVGAGVSSFTLNIAKNVRDLRQKMGLTIEDLTEMVGMSQGQVFRLENGKHSFRSGTLRKFADALGVTVARLAAGGKQPETLFKPTGIYGPGLPDVLVEALGHPDFRRYAEKCAKLFMSDDVEFSKMTRIARSVKLPQV
jgi:transcriptional regulator with XRE-family HTH domain